MHTIKIILFYIFFLLPTAVLYCQVNSIGLPEISNYKKSDYKGGTQNWNIDQDKNGNIYIANNNGLLHFDGNTWTNYQIPNSTEIKSVKIDPSGKIFVGSWNEFGYFIPNSKGKLKYHSLSAILKKYNIEVLDNIWKIHIYKKEVIFQSFYAVFILSKNKIKVIKAPHKLQFSFLLKNKLYFQDTKNGLLEYKNNKLYALQGTNSFNNKEIWGMFQMPNNNILIATIYNGLFIYKDQKVTAWENETNTFIKKNSCLGGVEIKNNYIVLNSILNGVIVSDKKGNIIQHINREKGLQNNTVLTSFVDNKNNLWLGLDNGITFINEGAPFTYLGFSFNISAVYATVIHKGNLYVATNQGLFYHSWNTKFKDHAFSLVQGTTGQAWNIQVIDDQLLCSHNKGALLINDNKTSKLIDGIGYWSFKKIPNKPNFIIGSNYNGFSIFEKKENGFQLKNKISGHNKSAVEFEIDDKAIWTKAGDITQQLVIDDNLKAFTFIKNYTNLRKDVKGIGSIQKINNIIYFQKNNVFFNYSYQYNTFIEDLEMTSVFKNIPNTNHITEDEKGNLWYLFDESLGLLKRNAKYQYKNLVAPFSNLTGNFVRNHFSVNTVDKKTF